MKAILLLITTALAIPADDLNRDLDSIVKKVVQSKGKLEGVVDDSDVDKLYAKFRQSFRSEEKLRSGKGIQGSKEKFAKNVKDMIKHNAKYEQGEMTYKQGISKLSDLDYSDVLKHFTGSRDSEENGNHSLSSQFRSEEFEKLFPKRNLARKEGHAVDWSSIMPPIEDQGTCGCCYSFAAVGLLEAAYGIKNNKPISLSKQQVVDCDSSASGCDGGYTTKTLEYLKKGVKTAKAYKYEGKAGKCRASGGKFKVSKVMIIPAGDEEKLIDALGHGAVSITMHVTNNFMKYKSGIFREHDCKSALASHCMLAIGYGEENNEKYVLVRNSWGESWGERGLVRIILNNKMACGIANRAMTATVE